MQYQGGKSRIAKEIAEVIINEVSRRKNESGEEYIRNDNEKSERGGRKYETFISLFCGACSVETKLVPYFQKTICNDKHNYLIALYKALQNGYIPPDYITEEEYKRVKENINSEPPEYIGFVGFGSSFGGKWFGGYGKSKKGNGEIRWHSEETKRALLRDIKILNDVEFTCKDYRDVEIPSGSVIYCDPPYANSTTYKGFEKFDINEFWNYMRVISKDNLVFISEQTAPDDFECIWQKSVKRTLDSNKNNQIKAIEKLFIYNM